MTKFTKYNKIQAVAGSQCIVDSSYENNIWTMITRSRLFLASNVTLWELRCAVTACRVSHTVTVACSVPGKLDITSNPRFGPAEWF